MFDYSILDRPIFIFAYDYKTYEEKRGMYFDVREELTGGEINEDELISLLKEFNVEENIKMVRSFRSKYVTEYGHATEATVDAIYRMLQKDKM
jgi:CDP-glycerol glycerophosphotransferase